jgi:ABC-type branched-subunit amino acid transport system ATPase component/branched-subunit amino acid ABC-type transport system permease component
VEQLLGFIIAGGVAGSLYAIVASGLVLTYSTSGVFNFAQGAVGFVVAVCFYELNSGLHWPVFASALMSIVVLAPLIGFTLDRVMFRGLARAGSTAQIVATVGLSVALPAMAIFVVERARSLMGADIPTINNVVSPPGLGPVPASVFHLFGRTTLDTNQVATLVAAAVTALGLWMLVRHSRLGLHMRASVDRRELAALRGIDPDRSSSVAWMLSSMLAGLAGVLGAPLLALGSSSFTQLMLVSAAAAVFARLRSIPLAFAAGLTLGIIQDLVAGYVNPRINLLGLSTSVPYLLLFVGLLVLLIDRKRRARTVTDESPPSALLDEPVQRGRGVAWTVALAALVVYTLFVGSDFWVGLIISGLCFSLIFLSFTVVTGIGGMVSLAQATFVTAAGLTAAILTTHGVPYLPALIAGVAVAMALGALVALPALRLGGIALALATLALAYIGDLLVFQINWVSNNNLGWNINRPALGPLNFGSDKSMAMLVLVLVLAVVLVVRNLQRSPSGRAMLALRSAPAAAPAVGISPVVVKLGLFTLSAAIAGLGGVMATTFSSSITNQSFPAAAGLFWLAIVVTFGVRKPAYAVVAGLVYAIFPQVLSYVTTSTVIPQILFGLGGVALARNPDGFLSDTASSLAAAWRRLTAPRVDPAAIPVLASAEPSISPAAPGAGFRLGPPATRVVPANGDGPVYAGEQESPEGEGGLRMVGLHAGYGAVDVLHGVDISVGAGQLVAVLGPNGAGKSTLCKVAAGLVVPTAGTVHLGAVECTRRPAQWRAARGLILAPEAGGIFPGLTVEENLRLVLRDPAEREMAYDRFPQLAQRRRLAAGVLSGGEQQMLTLAPLLVHPPAVFIADEPSLGLAPQIVNQIFDLFLELRDRGVALLVVEEKVRDVLPVADAVVIMNLGRVAWAGQAGQADTERLAESYLGLERIGGS